MKKIAMQRILPVLTVLLLLGVLIGCQADPNEEAADPTGGVMPEPSLTEAPLLPEEAENPPALPDEGVWIVYTVNSSKAGRITGSTKQRTDDGQTTTKAVTAVANLGYRFVRWSDGVTEEKREGDTAESSEYITAIFDYEVLDLPIVLLTTETQKDVTSKTEYISGTVEILNAGSMNLAETQNQIRGRGNNTWTYDKKSYKLHFDEKISLLNVGQKSKTWILMANVCDQSLLRNQTAMQMVQLFDEIAYEPSSRSVEVYLNGAYRGVYLLAEETTLSSAHVDLDDSCVESDWDTGYLVETSTYAQGITFWIDGKQFEVKSDLSSDSLIAEQQLAYIRNYMTDAYWALKNGNREKVEEYINIPSLVDAYIAEEILKNLDMGWDSFYFNKDAGGKLNFGPIWDFDLTLGNGNETCQNVYNLYCATWYADHLSNQWFYAAMQQSWFRTLVTERWDELYQKVKTMPAYVLENGAACCQSYARNFMKWKIFGTVQNRETAYITTLSDYQQHYQYLAAWLSERIEWLNDFYHSKDYRNGASSFGNTNQDAQKRATALLNELKQKNTVSVAASSVKIDKDTFTGEGVKNLFDGKTQTKLCLATENDVPVTVRFQTNGATTITGYAVYTANDTSQNPERNARAWRIWGSVDGNEWVLLDFVGNVKEILGATDYTGYGFAIDQPGAYTQYKIEFFCREIFQISEIVFYENP